MPALFHWNNRVLYLTGVRNAFLDAAAAEPGEYDCRPPLGLLVTPATKRYLRDGHLFYDTVGIDNGCFTAAGRKHYTPKKYEELVRTAVERFADTTGGVRFATAPDVVCDWSATLAASLPMLDVIRGWGVPASLVLQDGATPETVPWGRFDHLFIGGSTEWKVGPMAETICREAATRHIPVHMGRVNSLKRLRLARRFACESADGTYAKFAKPEHGEADIHSWLSDLFRDSERDTWDELKAAGVRMNDPEVRANLNAAGWLWVNRRPADPGTVKVAAKVTRPARKRVAPTVPATAVALAG